MIYAKHQRWATAAFRKYLLRLLKRNFFAISVLGNVPKLDPSLPVILLPNHSSWWDGFFVFLLNDRIFRRRMYLMMLEGQLQRNPFFSRMGAFSIDPARPKSMMHSLYYVTSLLNTANGNPPLVCIFPQGELKSWGIRPLGFKPGLQWILERVNSPVILLSLAIRIEFLSEQRPEVFMMFGEIRQCDKHSRPQLLELESGSENLLAELEQKILNSEKGLQILHGTKSVNLIFENFRKKLRLQAEQ